MNLQKLQEAEAYFLELYPQGFEDVGLLPIIKRHNTAKIGEQVRELFAKENFTQPEIICENFAKIVSKSTLISLFEKPKVRDMIKSMRMERRDMFSIGLYEMLFGDKKEGFDIVVEILSFYTLAKWSIVTLIPYYFYRDKEFFIKPTTTKNILSFFEIEGLVYKPRPSYEFYVQYTKILERMRAKVSEKISPHDNAGFTGFLMMAMEE
ncbi:hypothetical protein [Sulfurospirillum diekertiae]|uniref:Uncharacterized protein n=1 Tax=Sulfurospirillum diekertiae TaxID=1854492 RepID=A0AA92FH81_9BACT|nr:hypothetical protein [Sulfurospirillum diekertiae]QIR76219.1 hypothetical protein FA584_08365 [Sulfurospirillum diekertiae]